MGKACRYAVSTERCRVAQLARPQRRSLRPSEQFPTVVSARHHATGHAHAHCCATSGSGPVSGTGGATGGATGGSKLREPHSEALDARALCLLMSGKHFVNLTNGLEALPLLHDLGLPYSFSKLTSTDCEQQLYDRIVESLDPSLLLSLAMGHTCYVYDYGCRSADGVPRALWYGLEFVEFVLNNVWFGTVGDPVTHGIRVGNHWLRIARNLKSRKKLKYYRKYIPGEVTCVQLVGVYATTKHDSDDSFYRNLMMEYLRPPAASQQDAIDIDLTADVLDSHAEAATNLSTDEATSTLNGGKADNQRDINPSSTRPRHREVIDDVAASVQSRHEHRSDDEDASGSVDDGSIARSDRSVGDDGERCDRRGFDGNMKDNDIVDDFFLNRGLKVFRGGKRHGAYWREHRDEYVKSNPLKFKRGTGVRSSRPSKT